jgi:hypothetical protein
LYVERLGVVLHYGAERPHVERAKKVTLDSKLTSYLQAK